MAALAEALLQALLAAQQAQVVKAALVGMALATLLPLPVVVVVVVENRQPAAMRLHQQAELAAMA